MKCALCEQRKGRRYCPAKASTICTQCCGEKRIIKIDCPESCEYLQVGRKHETDQEYMRHLDWSNPGKREKYLRVLDRHESVVSRLEILVAEERRASRGLTDRDLAETLGLLLATLQTEEKGILYEHKSNDLRIDGLRRTLLEAIRECRNPKDQKRKRLALKGAVECVEFLQDIVDSHMKSKASPQSYVNFLARNMPRVSRRQAADSGIIVPGR